MPGIGVTCDANPATRIMFYDDFTGPDNQPTIDKYEYDYNKIWACMGRNGINGVMRQGFIEEGDSVGWTSVARAAGSIQRWDGIGLAFEGVEYWNTLNAYNLWMNNAAGDRVIYRACAPSLEVFLHLGAALAAQPAFSVKVLTSAAGVGGTWSAPITLSTTPDFTQAGGYKNQRVRFAMPATWPELQFGAFNETSWYWCIECVTPAAASPQANVNFKDFLEGYFKYYATQCEIRHGDDGAGSSSSDFKHEGAHHIRFRPGAGRRWNNRITTGKVQIGTLDPAANRTGVRAGWAMTGTRAPSVGPAELFGGAILGVMDSLAPAGTDGVLRGNTNDKGRLIGMKLAGFANWQLGVNGGTMKRFDDVRVTKPDDRTGLPAVQAIRMVPGSSNPASDRLFLDCTPGAGTQWIYKATDNTNDPVVGVVCGHDDVSVAQIYKNSAGAGNWNFIRIWWGGPTRKWGGSSNGALANLHEYWYLTWRGYLAGGAPADGIVVRVVDSANFKQIIGTLSSGGRGGFQNGLSFAPFGFQDLFCAEDGGDGSSANPLVRDGDRTGSGGLAGMQITINPTDEAGFNPAYQTLQWTGPFARRTEFDATGAYVEHTWQREDMEVQFVLPLACPAVPPPTPIFIEDVVDAEPGELCYESPIPAVA